MTRLAPMEPAHQLIEAAVKLNTTGARHLSRILEAPLTDLRCEVAFSVHLIIKLVGRTYRQAAPPPMAGRKWTSLSS